MKKSKRLLSLAVATLTAVSLFSVSAFSSFADDATTYSITVSDSTSGYTYAAYQILTGKLSGSTLSDVEYASGIDGATLLDALKADSTVGSKFTDCTTATDVAEAMAKITSDSTEAAALGAVIANYVTENSIDATATDDYTDSKYEITGLAAGYYLVLNTAAPADSSAYTKAVLSVVKDTSVSPKRETPTVEKKVVEDGYTSDATDKSAYGDEYNDVADYSIGDTIAFELIASVTDDVNKYENDYVYTFTDTYSEGITPDTTSIKVYVETDGDLTTLDSAALDSSAYTVTPGTNSFTVTINNLKAVSGISKTAKVVVRYTGELNSNAVIGLDGNTNKVDLTYSNNPYGEGTGKTPEDKVIVFTYEVDTYKYDGNDNKALEGVEFVLLNSDSSKGAKVENGKFVEWVDVDDATTLTTDSTGYIKVAGLEDGKYVVKETKALDGYNSVSPVTITLTATTDNGQSWTGEAKDALTKIDVSANAVVLSNDTQGEYGAKVSIENNKGSVLPSTGGIGTTIFFVVGGIVVAAAVVILIARKRAKDAE